MALRYSLSNARNFCSIKLKQLSAKYLFKRLPKSSHYSSSTSQSQQTYEIECNNSHVSRILSEDMKVISDFLSQDEELSLLEEAEKSVKRLRYEFNHWDNAIHGYRETEKRNWNEPNTQIIKKLQHLAFPHQDGTLAYVHILDLAKDGFIKPHIDAVRFCGDTIAGVSLASSCVMRLVMESDKEMFANIYLPQRSLYIMKNRARYEFTHEVLKDEESYLFGKHIPRDRRISIMCRNEPRPQDTT